MLLFRDISFNPSSPILLSPAPCRKFISLVSDLSCQDSACKIRDVYFLIPPVLQKR